MVRGFGSDNHASVHPKIMAALNEANHGHTPSYGGDPWSEKAIELFRAHFGRDASVFFIFNGTAANVVSLRALTRPGQAVLCSDVAHVEMDEAAAPEFFIQGKLRPLPSTDGKIGIEALRAAAIRGGDVHYAQNAVLSLSQPTEYGTIYSLDELRQLGTFAKSQGWSVHIDGARWGVAAAALGVDLGEMARAAQADLVSFGGTKNGLLGGEAIICLKPELAKTLPVLRKQAGQLPSKSRFIAAQFAAYLQDDLWRELAQASIRAAARLADGVRGVRGVEITRPVQANAVFARISRDAAKKLRENHFFYVWDETTWECRWMTSWDLTDADIDAFISSIKEHA